MFKMDQSYRLELIKILTLLFREAEFNLKDTGSEYLIKKAIASMPVFESHDAYNDTLIGLRQLVEYYVIEGPVHGIDQNDILQRVRLVAKEDKSIFEALKAGIDAKMTAKEAQKFCTRINRELNIYISKATIKDICKNAYRRLSFEEDKVNWATFTREMINDLESHCDINATPVHESFLGSIDFSDEYSIKEALKEGKSSITGNGIMRTGWQGLNQMLDGGFRRGECVVVGGVQFGFKSGLLMNIPRQVALYNKPYMIDPTKKPLIIYISLENELKGNIIQMYKDLWEMKHKKPCHIEDINDDELINCAKFVREEITAANGYHFKMLRHDPSKYTYQVLFDTIRNFENEGYEIHLISFDYLRKAQLNGCTGARTDEKIRDLFSRVRNFCVPRQITFLTAHQISSEGKNLIREGRADFVKEIANKGYYEGCRSIDHEVDLEIMIRIEKPQDGHSYLTMMRGKHRGPINTPENHLYQVYRFEKVGCIPDDIGGASHARRQVGGGTAEEGNTKPWYED